MEITPLPFDAGIEQYRQRAQQLLGAFNSGDFTAIQCVKENHPRFRNLADSEVKSATLEIAEAQLAIAGFYRFESWPALAEFAEAITDRGSQLFQFESGIEAIITGDSATLEALLRQSPDLVRARSMRRHHSTLLLYVGANGVEGYRQKTPKNAVEIAEILLGAGSQIEAVGNMYGGTTTLGLVATSVHPFLAGVQEALIDTLLDHGAAFDGAVAPDYTRGLLVNACLVNGRPEAAEFLARRGAPLDLEAAAAVGRIDLVKDFLNEDGSPNAGVTREQKEKAFIFACYCGRTEVAKFLLERGVDIAASDGQTGLHMAAYGGHLDTVRFLLERNAPLEARNEYGDAVLGLALWSAFNAPKRDHLAIVETLIAAGAEIHPDDEKWIDELRRRDGAKC